MGAGASIEAGQSVNDASKGTSVAVEALKVVENGAADAGQGSLRRMMRALALLWPQLAVRNLLIM